MPLLLGDRPHRLSLDDVERMYEAEILTDEDRVELVDGVLYDVTPSGPEHSGTVAWLTRHLVLGVQAAGGDVRVQDTLYIADGFLSPDLIVLDEIRRHERVTTARLAVEVSGTTLWRDRRKVALYAAAGVVEYWIADVEARTLVVHRDLRHGTYASITRHADGESVPAPLGTPPVAVAELFG